MNAYQLIPQSRMPYKVCYIFAMFINIQSEDSENEIFQKTLPKTIAAIVPTEPRGSNQKMNISTGRQKRAVIVPKMFQYLSSSLL